MRGRSYLLSDASQDGASLQASKNDETLINELGRAGEYVSLTKVIFFSCFDMFFFHVLQDELPEDETQQNVIYELLRVVRRPEGGE